MIDNNYEPERIGIDVSFTLLKLCTLLKTVIKKKLFFLQCAKKYHVNWNKIYACSEGKEGEQLLKLNGEATDKLWPEVSFIPTITINNVIEFALFKFKNNY